MLVNGGVILRSIGQRSKVKVTGNENVKIVFRAYPRDKRIDLPQTKTRMIIGPLCTYRRIHFTSENVSFL